MKAWTVTELDNIVAALTPLLGLRLQEAYTGPSDVVLGFYSAQGILWLWIDLNAVSPGLLPWTELPLRPPAQKTPLLLFLRAHFLGRTLRAVTRGKEWGRVVHLDFGPENDGPLALELRLFAKGRNLLAVAGGKSLAWAKPQELVPAPESPTPTRPRDLETLREEWRTARAPRAVARATGTEDLKARLERELTKKRAAVAKVRVELERKLAQPWREVGDWLKAHQSLDVPRAWEPFVDRRRKLAWNIEQCFNKARELTAKLAGTERRLHSLLEEIQRLEARIAGPLTPEAPRPAAAAVPTLAKIQAQGRTLHLEEGLTAVMGKSAADNIKILRRARAWDLWFHLRDFPSSHAVLFRNKGAKVSDSTMFQVAAWFVRQHFGSKAAGHVGEKFDIIVTECRFVRPIKGDKIGRVTYRDERILIYQFTG